MGDRRKLLIVDDNQQVLDVLRAQLELAGYACDCVASIKEARRRLDTMHYDLLILDVYLNDGSGLDLLRGVAERLAVLPVLVITGAATLNTALDAFRLGVVDYLPKPLHDIEAHVERALAIKDKQRSLEEWASGLRRLAEQLEEGLSIPGAAPPSPPENTPNPAVMRQLSPREQEVVAALHGGARSAVEIGQMLFISPHTVHNHFRNIFRKLNITSRTQLLTMLHRRD